MSPHNGNKIFIIVKGNIYQCENALYARGIAFTHWREQSTRNCNEFYVPVEYERAVRNWYAEDQGITSPAENGSLLWFTFKGEDEK